MNKPDQRVILLALGLAAVVALGVGVVLKWQPSGGGDDGSVTSMATTTANETRAPAQPQGNEATPKSKKSKPKPKAPAVPTIVVRDGEPVGGIAELTYKEGERARFRVSSDSAEEIHLHGYDIGEDVEAGGTVTFDFTADLEGVFEVELEERATQIAELTVDP